MLAMVVSLALIGVGTLLAASFHFLGLAHRPEEADLLDSADLEATKVILDDLASPAHKVFAQIDPSYTREVVLFALDRVSKDLRKIVQRRSAVRLRPLFFVFRLYLTAFRLKTRFSASFTDIRCCIGFELFLLRRLQ